MENSVSNYFMEVKRQVKPVPRECTVCGAPAIYSYFGAVACQPCKVFFRRNAEQRRDVLKCEFDGHCDINANNRHVCSYCRLMKCLNSGMQTELIRSSHGRPNKRKKMKSSCTESMSLALIKSNELRQLPTLNLLQSDRSTLTSYQWSLLTNLSNCYDEHSGLSIGERFMNEQRLLPIKIRYKRAPMIDFIQQILFESQLLYKSNQDFLSLSPDDRSIILHTTSKLVGSLSSNFIIHKVRLMSCTAYFDTIGSISHPYVIPYAVRVANRLDFDMIIMKLFLAILSFSTIGYTVYSHSPPANISNIKQVLRIQNTYIELFWRYSLYKYGFEQAVKCLSNLIRCFFSIHDALVISHDVQWLTDTIDSLVQHTEKVLSFDT